MRLRGQCVAAVTIFYVVGFHSAVAADPISFSFLTTLTSVSDDARSIFGVQPGDSFLGTVSYELTGVTDPPTPVFSAFFQASGTLTLPFLTIPMDFVQVILNEGNPALGDFVGFGGLDENAGQSAVVGFHDPTGTLLSSLNVPDVSVLARFPGGPAQFLVLRETTFFRDLLVGPVGSPAPVPEPTTIFLLATGAATVAWTRRLRKRGDQETAVH